MDLFDSLVEDQVDDIVVLGDTGKELTVITPVDTKAGSQVCKAEDYRLPGDVKNDIYIVPVSGGADSAVTAMLMCEMFPEINWKFCFTDTGAEEPEIYDSLNSLEAYLGRPIERVLPDKDIWELLDQYGNYLPSAQSRWCTRLVKSIPFQAWLKQFAGKPKFICVGIRADESFRVAFTIDEATTLMPLLDLGWNRENVFLKLRETIGIPGFYRRRSRSGCGFCPFQRRQELIGLLQEKPLEFDRGGECEKLSERDAARHEPAPSLGTETGFQPNWVSLPLPSENDKIEGKLGNKAETMFGMIGVYIAAEFFMGCAPGGSPFIWKQRIVSFSTSQPGIQKQISTRYEHLLATAEAHDMDQWEVRNRVKFAVYYIEAPSDVFDPSGTGLGSYTWHSGESYRMLRHIHGWAVRVLSAHVLQVEASEMEKFSPISWGYENSAISKEALEKARHPLGTVVAMSLFKPKEPVQDAEIEEKHIPCAMCSL